VDAEIIETQNGDYLGEDDIVGSRTSTQGEVRIGDVIMRKSAKGIYPLKTPNFAFCTSV